MIMRDRCFTRQDVDALISNEQIPILIRMRALSPCSHADSREAFNNEICKKMTVHI